MELQPTERTEDLLREFGGWLRHRRISPRRASKHLDDVRSYLAFLTERSLSPAGASRVDVAEFAKHLLSYTWVDGRGMRRALDSVRRLYAFLAGSGSVSQETRQEVVSAIRAGRDAWAARAQSRHERMIDFLP